MAISFAARTAEMTRLPLKTPARTQKASDPAPATDVSDDLSNMPYRLWHEITLSDADATVTATDGAVSTFGFSDLPARLQYRPVARRLGPDRATAPA